MKQFLLLISFLLSIFSISCSSTPRKAENSYFNEVEIAYVHTKYLTSDYFTHISEFLGAGKMDYGKYAIRTVKSKYDGVYFFVMLDWANPDLSLATQVEITYDNPYSSRQITKTFVLPQTVDATREILFGITGKDWKLRDSVPSAWKIVIKDPLGNVLGQKKSFAWSFQEEQNEKDKTK